MNNVYIHIYYSLSILRKIAAYIIIAAYITIDIDIVVIMF